MKTLNKLEKEQAEMRERMRKSAALRRHNYLMESSPLYKKKYDSLCDEVKKLTIKVLSAWKPAPDEVNIALYNYFNSPQSPFYKKQSEFAKIIKIQQPNFCKMVNGKLRVPLHKVKLFEIYSNGALNKDNLFIFGKKDDVN